MEGNGTTSQQEGGFNCLLCCKSPCKFQESICLAKFISHPAENDLFTAQLLPCDRSNKDFLEKKTKFSSLMCVVAVKKRFLKDCVLNG